MIPAHFFFLEDPAWPGGGPSGPPLGTLALLGVGRCFIFWALGAALAAWLG